MSLLSLLLSNAPCQLQSLGTKTARDVYASHPIAQLERFLTTEAGLDLLTTVATVLTVEQREDLAAALSLLFAHTLADAAFLRFVVKREVKDCGA